MARCGCGGACDCSIVAGSNVTISGVGSAANPYTISATTASATGCGLLGNGTAVNPLRVNAGTWPYICAQTNGSVISCGADGVIRGDAPYHTYQQTQNLTRSFGGLAIPLADTIIDENTFVFQNPDPCRNMALYIQAETDVDITLPAATQVEIGHGVNNVAGGATDNRWAYANNGTGTLTSMHTQVSSGPRLITASVAPGANQNVTVSINGLRGTAGVVATRTQYVVRSMWLPA